MTRQNLPPGGSFAAAAAGSTSGVTKFIQQYQMIRFGKGHGTALAWLIPDRRHGSDARIQPIPQRGAEDAKRFFGKSVSAGLCGAGGAGAIRSSRRRDVADQGSRQHRRRAAESAGWLRL